MWAWQRVRGATRLRRKERFFGLEPRGTCLIVMNNKAGLSAATVDVMDEDTLRPAPASLYALTKFAAESILTRVAETQGISLTAARLGVVYGPWEYATGVRDTLSPMLRNWA